MYTGQKEKYIAAVFNFSHSPNTTTAASYSIAANTTRYLATIGGTAAAPATDIFKVVMVRAGTLKNLYYKALPASALTNATHKFTVFKNGAVPSGSEGLSAFWNPATKSESDLIGYINVVPGDVISVQVQTFAGTGTIIRPTVSFELEVDSDYPNPWDYDPASKIISYKDGDVEVGTDALGIPHDLTVDGIIHAKAGVEFPDGFVQMIAATGGGGGIPGISESGGKIGIGLDPTKNPQEKLILAPDSNLATEMPTPSGVAAAVSSVSGGLPMNDYYFRVTASDGAGWTKASVQLLFNLPDDNYGIRVSWNPVLGATKYRLYRALTATGAYRWIEITNTYYDYVADSAFPSTNAGSPPEETTAYINKLSAAGDSWLLGGKVGIGTTTPSSRLHVTETGGSNVAAEIGTNQSSAYLRINPTGPGGVPFRIGVNTSFLSLETGAGVGMMSLNSAGNVGIGTTDPQAKLDVAGNAVVDGNVGIGTTTPDEMLNIYSDAKNKTTLHLNGFIDAADDIMGRIMFSYHTAPGQIGIYKDLASIIGRHGPSGQVNGYLTFNTKNNGSLGESMRITHDGNVSVVGQIFSGSSKRWKRNIRTIKGALSKVIRLRGISYNRQNDDKQNIGLVAEEVGEVIPEIVAYEENGKDAQGLDYSRLVAVLIEAVKEQQSQIEELKETVKSLLADKGKAVGLA